MSIKWNFFDSLLIHAGVILTNADLNPNNPKQLFEKIEKFRKDFFQKFETAKEELCQINSYFTFYKIHEFFQIFEIYHLFLDELILLQNQEFPEHENNAKLDNYLKDFEIEYSKIRYIEFMNGGRESVDKKSLQQYNEIFFDLFLFEDRVKEKIRKTLDIFISLISKKDISDLQLKIFLENKLVTTDWSLVGEFYQVKNKSMNEVFQKKSKLIAKPELEESLEVIEEFYRNMVEGLNVKLKLVKKRLEDFQNSMSKLLLEKSFKFEDSKWYAICAKLWATWKEKKGKALLEYFSDLLKVCSDSPFLPRDKKSLTALNQVFAKQSKYTDLKFWLLSPSENPMKTEKEQAFLEEYGLNNLKLQKILFYFDTFITPDLIRLDRIIPPLLQEENFQKLCATKPSLKPILPYAALSFESLRQPVFFGADDLPVKESKSSRRKTILKFQGETPPNNEEKNVEKTKSAITIPRVIQQIVTVYTIDQLVQALFLKTCRSTSSQERIHYRQMHWHFLQLATLEKSLKEVSSGSFAHYLSAVTHAGWTIEQSLHARLKTPATYPHHLVDLAKQLNLVVDPLLKSLCLSNHWERYCLSYYQFYVKSTFFHKKEGEFSQVLQKLVKFSRQSSSKEIKNEALGVIQTTKEWVFTYLQQESSVLIEENKDFKCREDTECNFAVLELKRLVNIKKQFDQNLSKNFLVSSLEYRQLDLTFSLLHEAVKQGNKASSLQENIFWKMQMVRFSQNLVAALLEELFLIQKGFKSPYAHQIDVLAKECGIEQGWFPKCFEGLSIKTRYPLQYSSKELGCLLVDQLESVSNHPEQLTGFKVVGKSEDPWSLPEEMKPIDLITSLLRFWEETLKGMEIILAAFK